MEDWIWQDEPNEARAARGVAVNADLENSTFWQKHDLRFIGDLKWIDPSIMGYEYLSDLKDTEEPGFTYHYGLVVLANTTTVTQTMVCEVRNSSEQWLGFEMKIGDSWQPGPLEEWLQSLPPETQSTARNRYCSLVKAIRKELGQSQ